MGQKWELQACHIYREANGCTDALAKLGAQQQHLLSVYTTCPNFVLPLFGKGFGRLRE